MLYRTDSDLTRRQIFAYLLFGYAAGVFGAGFVADKVEDYLDYSEKPLDALATVIISAAAVQGYLWLKNGGVSRLPFVKKWLGEKS